MKIIGHAYNCGSIEDIFYVVSDRKSYPDGGTEEYFEGTYEECETFIKVANYYGIDEVRSALRQDGSIWDVEQDMQHDQASGFETCGFCDFAVCWF